LQRESLDANNRADGQALAFGLSPAIAMPRS